MSAGSHLKAYLDGKQISSESRSQSVRNLCDALNGEFSDLPGAFLFYDFSFPHDVTGLLTVDPSTPSVVRLRDCFKKTGFFSWGYEPKAWAFCTIDKEDHGWCVRYDSLSNKISYCYGKNSDVGKITSELRPGENCDSIDGIVKLLVSKLSDDGLMRPP